MTSTGQGGNEEAAGAAAPAGVIGVLGAGTMGSGIAQLAARSGARTLLHDPMPEALQKGLQRARDGLGKEAAKGKLSEAEAEAASSRLEAVEDIAELAPCELVIEAAPERIELKHAIYAQLSEVVGEQCVLASNTSSLLVTAIAPAASHPERVVGMHFFNPAPLMKLLEVVAGEQSSPRALAIADATGAAMGKRVIRASDGPGFLVNRCNRPFGLEALRLLQERIADVETIDRICRMQGGFRMGPFELMDLVGVDVGFEISKSFYEQSFGEPRWRPSPIAARYVAAGLHGRKSGRGYYTYPQQSEGSRTSHREPDVEPPAPTAPQADDRVAVITGDSVLAEELRHYASQAGYEVRSPDDPIGELPPALSIECDRAVGDTTARELAAAHAPADERATSGGAHIVLCQRGSLGALDPGGNAVGFHMLAPFESAKLVELTRSDSSSPQTAARAERFFESLGKHVAWVGDAPGLVLGRIVCQVINECAFAYGERVGSASDIDTGMTLGLSYPRGPLAWADTIGLDNVLALLEALSDEYREERYRPAPALRRLVTAGKLGRETGSGFFEYDVET
ncbi:MAG TPA: 3-hydroxyacyl-CoA dehydrogenase [Solirubrobacteraceae bacterium]|jgi:3-hydroxybutyryl-CoA dehydrogenase|nr:3-hydroxyacyl-CoA dehydrogenase [Solirubrobacteraceae bacterium]